MNAHISRTEFDIAKFQTKIAHDMIRMAAENEGVVPWLLAHGGSPSAPSRATRQVSEDVFGDTEDAFMFNAAMIFEIDRHLARAV